MIRFLSRSGCLSRLLRDKGGNVLMITAGVITTLMFALGFGVDYSRAMKLQSRLNAAADAAVLVAVNAPMMQQDATSAKTAATNMFVQQGSGLTGLDFTPATDLSISITTTGSLNNGRSVTVVWKARSKNIFTSFLGSTYLPLSGTAQSAATKAPYMNFYLVMDSSPSMLLPVTTAGLNSLMTATSAYANSPYGCAFACHEMTPRSDAIYIQKGSLDVYLDANYYTSGATGYQTYYLINSSNGKVYDSSGNLLSGYSWNNSKLYKNSSVVNGYYADGYWATHNYGVISSGASAITLRIDEERSAAQALIPYAQQMASANSVTYKLQMFNFDWTHPAKTSPVNTISSMTDVASLSTSSVPDLYAAQDWWYKNNCPSTSNCTSDMGTEFTNMLTTMNAAMATPGDGTTSSSPQEVMFLITDGMADEGVSGARWVRELNPLDLAQCTLIKNRGIKIAILYTEYLAGSMTGDSWSQSTVAPYLSNVSPTLKSCASTGSNGTSLFYTVSTDQSISDALVALFALTVQQAHLVQ